MKLLFGEFNIVLVLVERAGGEAEETVIERYHSTAIARKGRCHPAAVTGSKRGFIEQLRAARLSKGALVISSALTLVLLSSAGTQVS